MNFRPIWVAFLALFLILFGLFSVTTIGITWGKEIMGYSALLAGFLCVVALVRKEW